MANVNMDQNDDFPNCITERDPPTIPEPILDFCVRTDSNVCDNEGVTRFHHDKVLVKTSFSAPFRRAYDDHCCSGDKMDDSVERPQNDECAYLICDELRDALHGVVYHGRVIRRSSPTDDVWQTTGEGCAIKMMPWERIRDGRTRNPAENPKDEVAVMQYLKKYMAGMSSSDAMRETKIIMPLDFLFDCQNLYTITPFVPVEKYLICSGIERILLKKRVNIC